MTMNLEPHDRVRTAFRRVYGGRYDRAGLEDRLLSAAAERRLRGERRWPPLALGTAQVRRISMGERASGVIQSAGLSWRMRDHSHFVAFAPVGAPRYACAALVEHGGWGSTAAAPLVRDVMTYLFDKDKAMEALAPLEAQWGGDILQRMDREARAWAARPPGDTAPPVVLA